MRRSWIIGAAPTADIRVESGYVSSRHCRLVHDAAGWTLEDLGSTNGTLVRIARPMALPQASSD